VNMTEDVGSIQNSLLTGFINNPDHLGWSFRVRRDV
jgi:hypothetical protein